MKSVTIQYTARDFMPQYIIVKTQELLRRPDVLPWNDALSDYSIVLLHFETDMMDIISSLPPSLLLQYATKAFAYPITYTTFEEAYGVSQYDLHSYFTTFFSTLSF